MSIEERFWSKVQKADRCWLWTGNATKKGYGQILVGKKLGLAHRLSWEIHYGVIPKGLCVLHRCDNPPCVNPAHLFLGSRAVNIYDSCLKGRRGKRLTAEQVKEIDTLYKSDEPLVQAIGRRLTLHDLGRRYGVSRQSVWNVVHRKAWKQVERQANLATI